MSRWCVLGEVFVGLLAMVLLLWGHLARWSYAGFGMLLESALARSPLPSCQRWLRSEAGLKLVGGIVNDMMRRLWGGFSARHTSVGVGQAMRGKNGQCTH